MRDMRSGSYLQQQHVLSHQHQHQHQHFQPQAHPDALKGYGPCGSSSSTVAVAIASAFLHLSASLEHTQHNMTNAHMAFTPLPAHISIPECACNDAKLQPEVQCQYQHEARSARAV